MVRRKQDSQYLNLEQQYKHVEPDDLDEHAQKPNVR